MKLEKTHGTMIVSLYDRRGRMAEEFQKELDEITKAIEELVVIVLDKYDKHFDKPSVRIMQDGVYIVEEDSEDLKKEERQIEEGP